MTRAPRQEHQLLATLSSSHGTALATGRRLAGGSACRRTETRAGGWLCISPGWAP